MIRLIREGSAKYPFILKGLMIVIALTFIIGMGWFGFDQSSQPNSVAVVGPYKISLENFRRAYSNTYRFYKDQLKQEDVDEAMLKQVVLNGLVDSKLWLLTAEDFRLQVSPDELRDSITARKEFQKDGNFDPQYYQRLLAANRLTPSKYEQQRMQDLLAEKAQLIVQDAVFLNKAEMEEVEALALRQAGEDKKDELDAIRERIKRQFLFQKKQRALQAFQAAIRESAKIDIHREYL